MQLLISLSILALFVVGFFMLIRKQDAAKHTGSAYNAEFRTDFAIDECIDRLRAPTENDLFVYTFTREEDGSFWLHFTAHRATQQPVDTLYRLRFDPGKQTIVSLSFVREAFGYKEPVFPVALLDQFIEEKLSAARSF